ncbi:unnamed protein product [Ilex paraguariensis]|uniref:Uncharacterized protein n=1 Tax=Ilex paraguariensis TaxID=185542 RepID=A0ABC8RRR8_9AQUA
MVTSTTIGEAVTATVGGATTKRTSVDVTFVIGGGVGSKYMEGLGIGTGVDGSASDRDRQAVSHFPKSMLETGYETNTTTSNVFDFLPQPQPQPLQTSLHLQTSLATATASEFFAPIAIARATTTVTEFAVAPTTAIDR